MGSILAQCVKVVACFTLFSPIQSCLLEDLSLSSYKRLWVTEELERKILKKTNSFCLTIQACSLKLIKLNFLFLHRKHIYLYTYCLFQL